MNIFKRIRILKRKTEREVVNAINKSARVDQCLLCGKSMESACNSHVVPQFILKQIAENGKISYGYSMSIVNIDSLEKTTGINNAHTFKLICNKCDQNFFKEYESPDNLLNYEELNDRLKEKILMEMAIKARLSHISLKYKNAIAKDIASDGKLARLEKLGILILSERIEMDSHFEAINNMKQHFAHNDAIFDVFLNVELDYKTKIATQTIISFNYDLLGNKIYNYNYVSYDNKCNYFYLMIMPHNNKTRILFYIEKEYSKNVKGLVEQFKIMNFQEQIHFLFIALILHDEQFYLTPSLSNYIRRCDKKLLRLYSKTERNLKYTKKIRDYKKYNNYLARKYSNYGVEKVF